MCLGGVCDVSVFWLEHSAVLGDHIVLGALLPPFQWLDDVELFAKQWNAAQEVQLEVGEPAVEVCRRTISRTLSRTGLMTYRPVEAPPLTPFRCRARLEWARQHAQWTQEQWGMVVFSDETAIQITARRSLFVRRGRGAPIR